MPFKQAHVWGGGEKKWLCELFSLKACTSFMKGLPDEPVCVSVAGLPWHPARMQQAQTVPDTQTSHPHHTTTRK